MNRTEPTVRKGENQGALRRYFARRRALRFVVGVRRRRPAVFSLLVGTTLVLFAELVSTSRASADDGNGTEDDAPETVVERESCALGRGVRAEIVTETERESCGSGGCGQTQTISVEGPNGEVWLSLQNELGDFGERPPFEVACEGERVHVRVEGGTGTPELRFRLERPRAGLRLLPETSAAIEASFRDAPATDEAEIERRETLAELIEAVLPASGDGPESPPGSLGHALRDAARLLIARDRLHAGAWESAEHELESVPAGAARRAELVAALALARSRTQPLALSGKRRLGTMSALPITPLFPDAQPTLFWQRDELCVAQEDASPPRRMRCYSPARGRWGSAVRLTVPESSGQNLRSMFYGNVMRCNGFFVAQKRVPDTGSTPCAGGFGEDDDALVGVVEHDAMIVVGSPPGMSGLHVNRGPKADRALTSAEAAALLRSSAGSLVLGDGCCFLARDGRVGRLDGTDEQRWDVLGEPPPGERWSGSELVSPDQRWLVVASMAGASGPFTLWSFRVARR